MKPLIGGNTLRTLEDVAKRLIWWLPPDEAIKNENRLIAQIMTFGDIDDTQVLLDRFSKQKLKTVLADPPIGVFSPQAWSYWHIVLDVPMRAMPKRCIAEHDFTI